MTSLGVNDYIKVSLATNELRPEFLSINSLNPFVMNDSSSRGTMFSSSHIGQTLVVEKSDIRRCQTGTERKFGKHTLSIKFPCNAQILKVIDKFSPQSGIKKNPKTLVIYEEVETGILGMLELVGYSTAENNLHQHFGFPYRYGRAINQIMPNNYIQAGTKVADSPNVDEHGNYCYGVEANVAFMSVPGVIEDGVVASRSFLNRLKTKGYERRTASWGRKRFPVNLYGDENNYKPFPDVGDRIRPDGLLFCLREYDPLLAPVQMDIRSVREPDKNDEKIYAEANAKIVDVNVQHPEDSRAIRTPEGMSGQVERYYRETYHYHEELVAFYEETNRLRRGKVRTTPDLQRLLVESIAYIGLRNRHIRGSVSQDNLKRRVQKVHRQTPIDDWRVEVAFEYDIIPDAGFKVTDCHGGKGVICDVWDEDKQQHVKKTIDGSELKIDQVWEDTDMPVDDDGNMVDLIMDGDSAIKRMNLGRLYESYFNAASRDVSRKVREALGVPRKIDLEILDEEERRRQVVEHLKTVPQEKIEEAWRYLNLYYGSVSPWMREKLESPEYKGTPLSHVTDICVNGVYLWLPTNNPVSYPEVVKVIRDHFPPFESPVTYAGGVRTTKPVIIGSLYILLLEKTGTDWSATASSKLQHNGIPSKVSNSDKFSTPARNNPVRIMGEAEVRLFNAVVGSAVSADLLDQSNNPVTHKTIAEKLLRSNKPTAQKKILDRKEVPLGNSRSLQFVKHVLECAGIRIVREQDDPLRVQEINELASRKK